MRAATDQRAPYRVVVLVAAWVLVVTGAVLAVLVLTRDEPAATSAAGGAGASAPALPVVPDPTAPVDVPSVAPAVRSRPGVPQRLRVPALDVDTTVQPITTQGAVLTPPSNPQQVGWWRDGARPGTGHGRVLITGHTVHTGGGAFDHLDRLRAGDDVEIGTTHGWLRYDVTRVLFLTSGQLAARSADLFSQDGGERLVLVTCAAWDGGHYDGSTVVIARTAA